MSPPQKFHEPILSRRISQTPASGKVVPAAGKSFWRRHRQRAVLRLFGFQRSIAALGNRGLVEPDDFRGRLQRAPGIRIGVPTGKGLSRTLAAMHHQRIQSFGSGPIRRQCCIKPELSNTRIINGLVMPGVRKSPNLVLTRYRTVWVGRWI
jgi:hypothetical protein